jgi:hypothetical protein
LKGGHATRSSHQPPPSPHCRRTPLHLGHKTDPHTKSRIRSRPLSATSHRQTHLGRRPQRPKPPRNLVQERWAPRTATPQRASVAPPSPTLTKATMPKNQATNHFLHYRRNNTAKPTTWNRAAGARNAAKPIAHRRPPQPPLKPRPHHHSRSAPPQSPLGAIVHSPPPPQGHRRATAMAAATAQIRRGQAATMAKAPAVAILGPRGAPADSSGDGEARGEGEGRWRWRLGFATRVARGGVTGAFPFFRVCAENSRPSHS